MNILKWPDKKMLDLKLQKVTKFDYELLDFCNGMAEAMILAGGVGLAASQVGDPRDIFILDAEIVDGLENVDYMVFCNSKITEASDETSKGEEGCLSFPGLNVQVVRHDKITIEAKGINGNALTITAKDFLARAIQHEFEHLHQVYLYHYLPKFKKDKLMKKLKREKRRVPRRYYD